MKKFMVVAGLVTVAMTAVSLPGFADGKGKIDGKKEFDEHCVSCHPGGGNIVNPAKSLHKLEREANGVRTAKDIVKLMRKPGQGMTTFDKKAISNAEATAIAEYILKTFK
jgi:cytochrome c6